MTTINQLLIIFITLHFMKCFNIEETPIVTLCIKVPDLSSHYVLRYAVKQNQIDKGGMGFIYQFKDSEGNKKVIKAIEIDSYQTADLVASEINIMRRLDGNFDMMGLEEERSCYYNNDTVYLIMNRIKTDLMVFLTSSNAMADKLKKSPFWRIFIVHSIVHSVVDLHDLNIIHNDLKIDNIFIKSTFDFMLGDFGFSRFLDTPNGTNNAIAQMSNIFGTKGFLAPELSTKVYTKQSDVFALGVTIFQILFINTHKEYKQVNSLSATNFLNIHCKNDKVQKKEISYLLICQDYKDLLLQMMNAKNPSLRPTGSTLRQTIDNITTSAIKRLKILNTNYKIAKINTKNKKDQDILDDLIKVTDFEGFMSSFAGKIRDNVNNNSEYANFIQRHFYVFFNEMGDGVSDLFEDNLNLSMESGLSISTQNSSISRERLFVL